MTKEQLIQAAWEKGALKFLLYKHQYPIYDAIWACIDDKDPVHTSHVISCARQFGKSFTEMLVAVEFCLRNPESTVLFVAPLKSQASEIIYGGTYFTLFATCPPELKPTQKDSNLHFTNGSRLRLGGTDNRRYEDLRGGRAHLLILDEAGFMSNLDDGVIPALQPMLKTTKGKTIYSSTPPPTLDHDYVDIYRDHRDRGHFNQFTIFDDKHVSEADLAKVFAETKSTPDHYSTRFRREYLVEFVQEDTVRIARDWDKACAVETVRSEYFPLYHKYVAMDPGVSDLTAVLFGFYDYERAVLVVEDEVTINGPELNSKLLSELIKSKCIELDYSKVYRYIADNNNLHLIQDMGALYGLPFFGTTKTRLETKGTQQEGMVNKLNRFLAEGRIEVNPRCTMLLGGLEYGTWKKSGETREFNKSKTYGHFDHLAALIYMVRNLDDVTNPVPRTNNFNPAQQFMPNQAAGSKPLELSKLAAALRPARR